MIITEEQIDLATPTGPMRTYIYRPMTADAAYPGIIFFSEIFQQTGPIKRAARFLAGHGYIVAVPEIFHELNAIGTVLEYNQHGTDKGNSDKISKTIESYDADSRAVITHLQTLPYCTKKIGSIGICIGGHLSFRAAMSPEILAATCFYATDIHLSTLGLGKNDNSLTRVAEISAELLMVWGKQDPHIPAAGRAVIHAALSAANTVFTWHEFNAQHAFLRDEGARYDAELADTCWQLALKLFQRRLGGAI